MRRITELDGVRGVAALAILIFHWRFHVPILKTGVDLFFVLSGYLITTILLQTADAPRSLRTFFARRALRILPTYYLTFFAFLVLRKFSIRPHPLDALPYFMTYTQYVQHYWGGALPAFSRVFGHSWTLAIEEQFYLFWPFVVRLLGRKGLLLAGPALLALPVALRFDGMPNYLLATHCDGLVMGSILAAIFLNRELLGRRRDAFRHAFLALGLVACIPIAGLGGSSLTGVAEAIWFTRVSLICTCLVGLIVIDQGRAAWRPLRAPWLVEVGKMSYGLYLYHVPIFNLVGEIHFRSGLGRPVCADIVKLALTFAVARLSWVYLERPLLRLKDRIGYGPHRDSLDHPGHALPAPHASARTTAGRGESVRSPADQA